MLISSHPSNQSKNCERILTRKHPLICYVQNIEAVHSVQAVFSRYQCRQYFMCVLIKSGIECEVNLLRKCSKEVLFPIHVLDLAARNIILMQFIILIRAITIIRNIFVIVDFCTLNHIRVDSCVICSRVSYLIDIPISLNHNLMIVTKRTQLHTKRIKTAVCQKQTIRGQMVMESIFVCCERGK